MAIYYIIGICPKPNSSVNRNCMGIAVKKDSCGMSELQREFKGEIGELYGGMWGSYPFNGGLVFSGIREDDQQIADFRIRELEKLFDQQEEILVIGEIVRK